MIHMRKRRVCAGFIGLLCLTSAAVNAATFDATWQGGYGQFWNNATQWDIGVVPNNGTDLYNVYLNAADGDYCILSNGDARTVHSATIGSGTTLEMRHLSHLTVAEALTIDGTIYLTNAPTIQMLSSTIVNNGRVYNSSSSPNFTLIGGTDTRVSGSGAWDMQGYLNLQGNITLASDVSIRNKWYSQLKPLSIWSTANLTNHSTLVLERKAGTSDLVQISLQAPTVNDGRIEMINGAEMYVFANTNNTGGVIDIDSASNLHVSNGATLTGGNVSGEGSVYVYGQTNPTKFKNVTLGSGTTTYLRSREQLQIRDTVTNDGTIVISGSPTLWNEFEVGYLEQPAGIPHGATLNGTGTLKFTTGYGNENNEIWGYGLTHGPGHTIKTEGADTYGEIYTDLNNQGAIDADTGRIEINSANLVNTGTLKASNGGQLVINHHGSLDNTGGQIIAEAGSTLQLYAGTITGGTVGGSGTIQCFNPGVTLTGDLVPGASPGSLDITGGTLTLTDTARLVMEINGTNPGEYDVLNVAGGLVLDGELKIVLGSGFTPPADFDFPMFTGLSNITGQFDQVAVYHQGAAEPFGICDVNPDGDALVINNIRDIPEPASLALLMLSGLASWRRPR